MTKLQIPQLNIIDKTINLINPVKGLQRFEARTRMAVLGGYMGARTDRRQTKTWQTPGGSADSVSLGDLPVLRNRSRDLMRNAPLACGAVNTVITNVIGTGLTPQSHIDRDLLKPYFKSDEAMEEFEKDAERIFKMWAENRDCDITRSQNFTEMQALILRSCLESGDVFVIRKYKERHGNPFGTSLQIVEADRVELVEYNNKAKNRLSQDFMEHHEYGQYSAEVLGEVWLKLMPLDKLRNLRISFVSGRPSDSRPEEEKISGNFDNVVVSDLFPLTLQLAARHNITCSSDSDKIYFDRNGDVYISTSLPAPKSSRVSATAVASSTLQERVTQLITKRLSLRTLIASLEKERIVDTAHSRKEYLSRFL